MSKNVAIYNRVSTQKQASEGYSLPTQLEACQKYAAERGYNVVAEFADVESGTMDSRPGLDALRELIAKTP
jgi:site-specific DNA recombinase